MNEKTTLCICGKPLAGTDSGNPEERRELRCVCGRLYELEFISAGWTPGSEAIVPEARQPLAGFSLDLKMSADCERYYFFHSVAGRRLPVHILFSPSSERAEVKTGDRKVFEVAPVRSVVEARRRWIERFDNRRGPRRLV